MSPVAVVLRGYDPVPDSPYALPRPRSARMALVHRVIAVLQQRGALTRYHLLQALQPVDYRYLRDILDDVTGYRFAVRVPKGEDIRPTYPGARQPNDDGDVTDRSRYVLTKAGVRFQGWRGE